MKGKLQNAPIYYAVVQAQFSPVAAMSEYVNLIQDKLRFEDYPNFQPQNIKQLQFDASSPAAPIVVDLPFWKFTNNDQKSAFVLSQTHLTYHTTKYDTHEHFFRSFLLGLREVHSIVKLNHLNRLGLRYLNAILPEPNETVNDYLIQNLHGIDLKSLQPRYSLCESVFNTSFSVSDVKGTLINRVYKRFGKLSYPPDISSHELIHDPKFTTQEINHAIIDIDHYIQEQLPLNFDSIEKRLRFLHTDLKKAFIANTTEHAVKVWK